MLDGLATAAIGDAAGGPLATAFRLGLAMTLIQFAIGATNDVVDAPFERARSDKSVAAGAVPARVAAAIAVTCAVTAIVLVVPSGLPARTRLGWRGACSRRARTPSISCWRAGPV